MSIVYTQSLKYSEGGARRNQEMESNIGQLQQHCLQNNSGLLRYRSAPSSFLTSLVDNEENFRTEDGSEMETMLARLTNSEPLRDFGGKLVKEEEAGDLVSKGPHPQHNHNDYSYGASSQLINYQQPQQIQGNVFDGSFSAVSSLDSENYTQTKIGSSSSNCSNLIRQKSSPAGFFSNYSVDNGLSALGSFRGCDVSNGQATTSTSGLHGTLNFSSRPSSCSSRMPQIAEDEHQALQANCVESENMRNDNVSTKGYMPNFTADFWDGSAFSATKTAGSNGEIMFSTSNALETQDSDFGYQKLGLSHHLSLPSSSTKMAAMERFLQVQGSVPCKIRAKRGFATHPRSIAERERRIRISSRIKKLQDLFPKSDKPTSTSDMLDLAVEYIKDLRKQVQILTETRANCTCRRNTQT